MKKVKRGKAGVGRAWGLASALVVSSAATAVTVDLVTDDRFATADFLIRLPG